MALVCRSYLLLDGAVALVVSPARWRGCAGRISWLLARGNKAGGLANTDEYYPSSITHVDNVKKSRIRKTPTLSTDADIRTNTNLKRLVDFFFFIGKLHLFGTSFLYLK